MLRHPVQVRTSTGAVVTVYEDVDDVWGNATPLMGAALWYAQQFAPKATATVLIRYRADVEENWQFVTDAGVAYTIRAEPVDVEGKGALLLTQCEALHV